MTRVKATFIEGSLYNEYEYMYPPIICICFETEYSVKTNRNEEKTKRNEYSSELIASPWESPLQRNCYDVISFHFY